MAIKHAYTSPVADNGDPNEVGPDEWNANHTIDPDTITYAQLQNVSAGDRLLGRITGTGDVEEIACTAAGRALLDDATAADQRTTLGLGTAATQPSSAFEPAGAVATHAALTTGAHGMTAFGASLVNDVTAAEARTTLGLAAIASTGSGADLAASSVTLGKLQNIATQRVLARKTAGSGPPEEVTASEVLDFLSTTPGALLTRGASTWAAASRVAIHDNDLTLDVATMSAPAAGKVKLAGYTSAGREMLAYTNDDGRTTELQAFLGRKFTCEMQAMPASNNHDVVGMTTWSSTGSVVAKSITSTSLVASVRRAGMESNAGGGSVASFRHGVLQFWRGNDTLRGGFHALWRFVIDDAVLVATGRTFVGFLGQTTAPADADPSTFTNILGIGNNNGDTTLQFYAAGAVAQARVDLGANFPANTINTDLYELALYAPPNGAFVSYTVIRLNTGDTTSGTITNAANLPASTQFLAPHFWRGNGGTASAVQITYSYFYGETEV